MNRWVCSGVLVLVIAWAGFAQNRVQVLILETGGLERVPQAIPNALGGGGVVNAQPVRIRLGPGGPPLADPPPSRPGVHRPVRPAHVPAGPPKFDRHGDPLPPGAVTRYGTVRLRHGPE